MAFRKKLLQINGFNARRSFDITIPGLHAHTDALTKPCHFPAETNQSDCSVGKLHAISAKPATANDGMTHMAQAPHRARY